MTLLNNANLATIGKAVPVPTYDREQVRTGIVHIGVGGFHRAHEAMYVDSLMERGGPLDWGITGVGLLPGDRRMAEVMAKQDCLYTLVLKHPDGSRAPRVIGSLVDYLFAPEQPEEVLRVMTDPSTRIVSLTITEGGYHVNQTTGDFDAEAPNIQRDLVPGAVPEQRVRLHHRGTGPSTCRWHPPVHGHVLRQHSRQRRGDASNALLLRRVEGPLAGGLDAGERPLPGLDGGPHHPGHHRR